MKKLKLLSCTLLLALVACGGATTPSNNNPTSSDTPVSEEVSNPETPTSEENPVSEEGPVSEEVSNPEDPTSEDKPAEDPFKDAYTPVEFDTTKDVTIKFYSTMGQNLRKVYDIFIEDFNEMYPNITVEHTTGFGYDELLSQIKTELSVGEGPDIAYCYADHVATYNKTKKVVKLDKIIADETYGLSAEQKADFIEGYYNEGSQFGDGYMYTLPFSKSTEVLYYNKEFFAKHNLTVPTTWDEMEETCRQIKAIDPTSIPLGYDSEANLFITMCEQLDSPYTSAAGVDGEHFLFDNDVNKAFTKRLKSWYDNGYLTTQEIYGSFTSGLFTETGEGNQKCYMCIGSSAGASHQIPAKNAAGEYPFTTGIAPIPQYNENNKKVISQGPSLCLFNQKDPQKVMASWLLMKFLTTDVGFQAQFSMDSGYVPVLKSVQEFDFYKNQHLANAEKGNGYISALSSKVCLEQVDNYFTSDAFLGSSDARVNVGAMLQAILTYSGTDLDAYIDQTFANTVYQCNYAIGNV